MRDLAQGEKDGLNAHDSVEDGALPQFCKKDSEEETLDPLYEMIEDGDMESRTFLLKEEDAVTDIQLVHVGSDSTVNFINGECEAGLMGQALADKDHEDKDDSAALSESEDPATERNGLMAQLKILEAMLQHLQGEVQQRSLPEDPLVNASPIGISSSYLRVGDSVNLKRQRRPNPKYFDMDIEAEFLASGTAPPSAASLRTCGEKSGEPAGSSDGRSLQHSGSREGYASARSNADAAPLGFFDCCAARPAGTHRARTALTQKPRVFPLAKVPEKSPGPVNSDTYLDNLSIRELHETYRSTFGKETSVKDKLWLKRQIFMGSSKPNGSSMGKENNRRNAHLAEINVKARLEKSSSAEEPLSDFGSTGINGGMMSGIGPPGSSPSADVRTDAKRPFRKTLSLAVLSPSDPSVLSPTVEGGREILGAASTTENVVEGRDKGPAVGGKRLRRPNRRYIEDQGNRGFGIGNGYPSVLSTYLSASNALRSKPLRLSWRTDADVVGDAYRNSTLRSTGHGIRPPTRSNIGHGRRSKSGVVGAKRKSEGQAAPKLVKMIAQSARAAARHDGADGTVRKVKFRLPAAPGQDKGDVLHGGDGEQVSCLLPILTNGNSEDHQILSSHYLSSKLEDASSEEPVITVPTANGGTRRKHHRPWTLREVVTLVDGVARCGGGKWADIKKLAFSTVGYRTAVDLKDKWRNLLRASRAQLHPPKEGETRKKHFSASIPGHILARVRELAALNNQMVAATNAGSSTTSRSGRTVNRR